MSQLHERLEHLVNYSSQLIFVSSDSVAIQQRNLSEFLALQHESTEVSFFSAQENENASDYRRTICRQLADHTVGSFVRPLCELLSDLDASKGHYLVCISQAQCMDMDFLNELWEWVTSSRQHNEDLHINIILFADPKWTEEAQRWLPSHHTNKPVLLSSQSVDAVGFDVSALENLMAQKRAFFANDDARSIVRKNWFIAAVLALFVVIFVALMSFQYPTQVKAFLASGTIPNSAETADNETQNTSDDEVPDNQNPAVSSLIEDKTDLEQTAALMGQNEYVTQLEVVDTKLTDDLLVSNWPSQQNESSQSEQIEDNIDASITNESSAVEVIEELDNAAQEISAAESEQSSTSTQQANGSVSDNPDFAVPDIVSVQQLNRQLAQQSLPNTQSSSASAPVANDEVAQYPFDEAIILDLPQTEFVLQLAGIQNASVLASYIGENALRESVWIYQTQRYGGPWFVVLLNRSFSSIEDASAAITQLPQAIQQAGPFAKRVTQVQQEIRGL